MRRCVLLCTITGSRSAEFGGGSAGVYSDTRVDAACRFINGSVTEGASIQYRRSTFAVERHPLHRCPGVLLSPIGLRQSSLEARWVRVIAHRWLDPGRLLESEEGGMICCYLCLRATCRCRSRVSLYVVTVWPLGLSCVNPCFNFSATPLVFSC